MQLGYATLHSTILEQIFIENIHFVDSYSPIK